MRSSIASADANFINVLRPAFKCANPKSAKKLTTSLSFFALLGSGYVKALRDHVSEIDP